MHLAVVQGYVNTMASLIPLIQDILPMILPASVAVTKAADVLPHDTQPDAGDGKISGVRVISRDAIVNKTDKMCASVLVIKPKSSSSVRHHGEQETIIYAVSGKGVLLSHPKDDDEPERHELSQGDFAFIPAWTEHQVQNECDTADLHLVLIRSGGKPVEVHLADWGGAEVRSTSSREDNGSS
ncbi:hypothetical protein VTK56DRAFT_3587 [Thermocarpiscus australiensis]